MADHAIAWTDGTAARAPNARHLSKPPKSLMTVAAPDDTVTLTGPADSALLVTWQWGTAREFIDDQPESWTGSIVFTDGERRAIGWTVTPADGSPARSGAINWQTEN